ncbi:MAG: aminoacyl-tRNA hydrolase [Gammaproteobacteria bacterium]
MSTRIALIVGLGNPGPEYERTRHNAGQWYVERLADALGARLSADPKYHGLTARVTIDGGDVRLLVPTTFMNRSGQATSALATFFKVTPEQMLVAHDELDMPPGTARLKLGGGHGGHNGLRDIVASHGNNANFLRLRIGIGRPPHKDQVTPWVLGRASAAEQEKMDKAIAEAVAETPTIVTGDIAKAMNRLNSFQG